MKFAVASQNFRTITAHAGKTRRFVLYDAEPGTPPVETGRLDLPKEMAFHGFAGGPHPLDAVDVVIAGSAGPGFVARLRERGVVTVATAETDPLTAVAAYLDGTLPPPDPHDGHGHGHSHGHA
ncbi:NifB/NifX family molybdenum-iron cluster-binding protein [Azospirillum halopraeferens]|uniref:NifB/NifX family molybdenum-iron cluster-binding protein n=1 Tax=Azospirillum halopraeferens TaxID=34010 RepID=UPI0004136766|nr:NifB/NifX family molybdenum-iron cluster-binding protein [Azospirillum halopraeferens]